MCPPVNVTNSPGKYILFKLVQPAKADCEIVVTKLKEASVKAVQFPKASSPIFVANGK